MVHVTYGAVSNWNETNLTNLLMTHNLHLFMLHLALIIVHYVAACLGLCRAYCILLICYYAPAQVPFCLRCGGEERNASIRKWVLLNLHLATVANRYRQYSQWYSVRKKCAEIVPSGVQQLDTGVVALRELLCTLSTAKRGILVLPQSSNTPLSISLSLLRVHQVQRCISRVLSW